MIKFVIGLIVGGSLGFLWSGLFRAGDASEEPHEVLKTMEMMAADTDIAFAVDALETKMGDSLLAVVTVKKLHVRAKPIDQLPAALIGIGETEILHIGGGE